MTSAAPVETSEASAPSETPGPDASPFERARAMIPDAPEGEGDEAAQAPGEETASPAKEGEAKPEEKLSPKERAFAALRRKQERLSREKAEFEQTKAQTRAAFEAEMARLRAENERLGHLSEIDRLAKADPKAAADKLGLDFTKLSQAFLQADTPEAKLEQQQKMLEQMAQKIESYESERKQAAVRAQAEAYRAQAEKAFVGVVRGAEGDFPELSVFDDSELVEMGHQAADKLAAQLGRAPKYDEIARALEEHFAALEARKAAKRSGLSPNPNGERDTPAPSASKHEAPRAHSRSLTNRVAAEISGRERPLSSQERFELARKQIE